MSKYILFLCLLIFSNSSNSEILTRYHKDRIASIQRTVVIPPNAYRLQSKITTQTNVYFGMANHITTVIFAQIYQESKFNPRAQSKYASGLTQFTPATAKEITNRYKTILKFVDPFNEDWAIHAILLYNKELMKSCKDFMKSNDSCDIMACALASYNGGFGWMRKEARLAGNSSKYFDNIELYSGRDPAAKKENREYPVRILYIHSPVFLRHGFGTNLICK